jgi:3-deoxy-D-manno-octulosonic-acid transferase
MGNLKIDIAPLNPSTETDKAKYKDELGFPESSVILVGISTWLGEEKFLLETLQMIRDKNIDARLLLIPRHAERRSEIIKEISSHSFSYQQRTKLDKNNCNAHVYLADTTGELNQLIQSADLAFLGKTLPPRHEGQNPIEPVSIGLPLVIGPRCTNFSEICDELVQKRAVTQGNSKLEIMNILIELAQSKKERKKMRKNGLQWRQEQHSPSRKTFAEIKKLSVQ